MSEAIMVDAAVTSRDVEIQFSALPGSITAVIGPNGAGKSTLLRLLAGGLRPDRGEVRAGGQLLAGRGTFVPAHRRRISFVDQRPLLFAHMTVCENVAFGPRARGMKSGAARQRAMRELAAVGCAELASRKPGALSGGQAQRVSIARALAVDPGIMLLDEPFASLDLSVTPQLRRLLAKRLKAADLTTVLVTHDLLDVLSLADQLLVLEAGRVVADGPVDQVCAAPASRFLADFLGVNLVHGTAIGDGELRLPGGQVLTGVRGNLAPGRPGRATIDPAAISLHSGHPGGSPRNSLQVTVQSLESRGAIVRVTVDLDGQRLQCDLTGAAVRELDLSVGENRVAVVKATQIQLFAG